MTIAVVEKRVKIGVIVKYGPFAGTHKNGCYRERWSLVEVQPYIIKTSEKQKEDKSTDIGKGPINM